MSSVSRATTGRSQNWRAGACLAGLLVLGLIAFQTTRSRPHPATPVNEATAMQLIRHGTRFYRTNENQPFDGSLVERYPGGALKSRSRLIDGLLNGISEGWYTNGQVEVVENFKAGVSEGKRSKWYPNGTLLSETTIHAGEHDGTFRRWHENGQLAEQVEMKHGQPDGLSLAYYPSGNLKARTRMENGKLVEQKFWNDGAASPDSAKAETHSP
jgi:hypothetical protein